MDRAAANSVYPSLKPLADCRLYTFVDTGFLAGRDPRQIARDLCAGGADIIQLRAKDRPVGEIRAMAEGLLPITRAAGVWLVINDHVSVALQVGAPACHLGQEDFFEPTGAEAVCLTPSHAPVSFGLSTHAPDQAVRAVAAGAHYLAIGPVFATGTKPTARPVTLEYVRWAADHIKVPWFAIGGITLGNLRSVLAAGARRVCVVSAILNSADITSACREFRSRLID